MDSLETLFAAAAETCTEILELSLATTQEHQHHTARTQTKTAWLQIVQTIRHVRLVHARTRILLVQPAQIAEPTPTKEVPFAKETVFTKISEHTLAATREPQTQAVPVQ